MIRPLSILTEERYAAASSCVTNYNSLRRYEYRTIISISDIGVTFVYFDEPNQRDRGQPNQLQNIRCGWLCSVDELLARTIDDFRTIGSVIPFGNHGDVQNLVD